MRKKMLLVINPVAGKSRGKYSLFSIVNLFHANGYKVTVFPTQARADAAAALRDADEDYDLVVCCGGDGTLNEVITGLMSREKRPHVGFIPVGTTNDLATSLNLPRNPLSAARKILAGPPLPYDVGKFNDSRYFAYIACFGAFSDIPYITSQAYKNAFGHAAYIFEGVKHLGEIVPHKVRVEWDGGDIEGEFLFGAVTNSTSIGGIVRLKPEEISLNDGFFDVFLIRNSKNLFDIQRVTTKIIAQNYQDEYLHFFKASRIRFTCDEGLPWCLDGEDGEVQTEAVIENLHSAVTFAAGGYKKGG